MEVSKSQQIILSGPKECVSDRVTGGGGGGVGEAQISQVPIPVRGPGHLSPENFLKSKIAVSHLGHFLLFWATIVCHFQTVDHF